MNQVGDLSTQLVSRLVDTIAAPRYDGTVSYSAGSFVTYIGEDDEYAGLYRCTDATSGTWDDTKWVSTTIIEAIQYLISQI